MGLKPGKRFRIEHVPESTTISRYFTYDQDYGDVPGDMKKKLHATQEQVANAPFHRFWVHFERAQAHFNTQVFSGRTSNPIVSTLKEGTLKALLKGGVEVHDVVGYGVLLVAVPKYCNIDEARKVVSVAVSHAVERFAP